MTNAKESGILRNAEALVVNGWWAAFSRGSPPKNDPRHFQIPTQVAELAAEPLELLARHRFKRWNSRSCSFEVRAVRTACEWRKKLDQMRLNHLERASAPDQPRLKSLR